MFLPLKSLIHFSLLGAEKDCDEMNSKHNNVTFFIVLVGLEASYSHDVTFEIFKITGLHSRI